MEENERPQTPPPEKPEARPMPQINREPEVKQEVGMIFESATDCKPAKQ